MFVRQGHYALDPGIDQKYPAADFTVEKIGDIPGFDVEKFRP